MWLDLEAGVARSLRREGVVVDVPPTGDPGSAGRRALVVEAAHTLLPEAGVDGLPRLARSEIAAGLTGRLRGLIARTDVDDPALPALRDEVVAELGGSADAEGALRLVDAVYLGRLLRGDVPAIITARCMSWYGHWRATNGGPSLEAARTMQRAAQDWIAHPDRRVEIDARIVATARSVVGDRRPVLVDVSV